MLLGLWSKCKVYRLLLSRKSRLCAVCAGSGAAGKDGQAQLGDVVLDLNTTQDASKLACQVVPGETSSSSSSSSSDGQAESLYSGQPLGSDGSCYVQCRFAQRTFFRCNYNIVELV